MRWAWILVLVMTTTVEAQDEPSEDAALENAALEDAEPAAERDSDTADASEATEAAVAPSENEAEARARFELGNSLYEQGRFEEAVVEFRRAHELSGRPSLLYNIYLAERDAGSTANAARALRRYLDEAEAPPNRAMLEQRLAALEEQVERDREAAERAAQAEARAAQAEAAADRDYTAPLVVMSSGAAVLLVAGSLGLANRALYDDLENRCYDGPLCLSSESGDVDSLDRRNLTADVMMGIGGAIALTGVIWLLVRAIRPVDDVETACGPAGCTVRGRF